MRASLTTGMTDDKWRYLLRSTLAPVGVEGASGSEMNSTCLFRWMSRRDKIIGFTFSSVQGRVDHDTEYSRLEPLRNKVQTKTRIGLHYEVFANLICKSTRVRARPNNCSLAPQGSYANKVQNYDFTLQNTSGASPTVWHCHTSFN